MSHSEVLYVKGMANSDTDEDEWDDKKLNDAYDKAVRIANIEVAKRVAMSTNTPIPKKYDRTTDPDSFIKKEKVSVKSSMKKVQMPKENTKADDRPKEKMWKPGMHCRLVFSEDGLEYEAVIVKLVEEGFCVVRYLGYDNQEMVPLNSLMPTHGVDVGACQIMKAKKEQEQIEDSCSTLSPNLDGMDLGFSDQIPSPDNLSMDFKMPKPNELSDRAPQKKKKPSKKKKNQARNLNINGFELPEIPPMPNLSTLRTQLGSTDMPMPPPPMAFASSVGRTDSEDQAISSMLLSWYMSGYYTGLYQGMKKAKEERRN